MTWLLGLLAGALAVAVVLLAVRERRVSRRLYDAEAEVTGERRNRLLMEDRLDACERKLRRTEARRDVAEAALAKTDEIVEQAAARADAAVQEAFRLRVALRTSVEAEQALLEGLREVARAVGVPECHPDLVQLVLEAVRVEGRANVSPPVGRRKRRVG